MAENAQDRVGQTERPASPAALIEAVGRGSRRALKQLYDLESRRLYGVALRIGRRPETAAGALRDAFVHIWQNAKHHSATPEQADAWLTGIVRRCAIAAGRKAGAHDETPSGGQTAGLEALASGGALHTCLAQIDPLAQDALVLAFVDGFDYPQLAEKLSEPVPALRERMRDGLLALGKCLRS